MAVTLAELRKIALSFPEVVEGSSYGTTAYKLRKKLLARLRDDDSVLVLSATWDERADLCVMDPDVFFFTDHYEEYEWVLIRLAKVKRTLLRDLFETAWRRAATKRMVADFEADGARSRLP